MNDFENQNHENNENHHAGEHNMDNHENNFGYSFEDDHLSEDQQIAAEEVTEDQAPKAPFEERQAEWLEQARDVATVEDLEFYKLELDEAIETMKAKKAEYQNAVVKRTLVYGRASVSADLGVSRKSLANLEHELNLDRPDVSEFYEELKKNQDREARRAERAAKKAAEEAAAVEALLSKLAN